MWDLPRPGLEPVSPALAGRFSTTVPPGKPKSVVYYGLGLGLGLWLDSWHYQGNRQWKAAALCDQSENNNPTLMEGWYLTSQAELQVAWMVPTGPPLTNLQVAIYRDTGADAWEG